MLRSNWLEDDSSNAYRVFNTLTLEIPEIHHFSVSYQHYRQSLMRVN